MNNSAYEKGRRRAQDGAAAADLTHAAEFRRIEARAERARWDRLGIPDDSKLNGWTADIAPANPFTIIRRNR